MPYYIGIRAYGESEFEDSDIEVSESVSIQAPEITDAYKSGSDITVKWNYTPAADDNIGGFKVYVGTSPTPDWDNAHDNGLNGGDSGSPTEEFVFTVFDGKVGTLYICVQSYSSGLIPLMSDVVHIIVNPSRPEIARADGISPDTGRWSSCLEVSPAGDPNPKARINGSETKTKVVNIIDKNRGTHKLTFKCGILVDYEFLPW